MTSWLIKIILLLTLEAGSLSQSEMDDLIPWIKTTLKGKATSVKVTNRLESHPCVITVEEMAAARHFIRTQAHSMPQDSHYSILQPQLELNPKWVKLQLL